MNSAVEARWGFFLICPKAVFNVYAAQGIARKTAKNAAVAFFEKIEERLLKRQKSDIRKKPPEEDSQLELF